MQTSENKQSNPWVGIWVKPRETLRSILEKHPKKWILTLALLNGLVSGIAWAINLSSTYPERPIFKAPWFLVTLVLLLMVMGVVGLYFGGWLYKLTGRWIGGKGTFTQVKCALGWSYYPYIIASLLGIVNLLTLKIPLLSLLFGLLSIVALVYAFVISLKLLGEAHQFSAWKALACIFIAAVLIFVVVVIIALIIPLIQPLFAN